ncbi:hypothetical protein EJ357_17265 [Streptomyces cyaneochromogenes]|uniref:Uncharacterized protein n=1 Tax=Streptomyces cyaneochromogenes TaxID=2496836 RepID=A0A3Q9ESD6_9ACTN|nr:hypothetical protein [Streptomyces cyaneochromogenes]AZQ35023.1 hypothetical protein EJ357_17265 [Streptomyces cyaneochromogenes]
MSVIVLVLVGVLVLAVGGCVCVVWASRGGPRWVRGVAAVTLALGELVRKSGRSGRGSSSNSYSDSGSSE